MPEPHACPSDPELRALVAGGLPEARLAAIAAHLEACASCRRRLELLAGSSDKVPPWGAAAPDSAAPSEAFKEAVRNLKADAEASADTSPSSSSGPPSLRFLKPSVNPRHLGRLSGYEILEVIGRGGMGTVLKARDSKLERLVAIKVLNPSLAASPAARHSFLREAQSAAAVTHEHVVTIHAVDDSGEVPFLVMEYLVGVSLEDRIQRSGRLRVEEILRIGKQTAAGLAAAHAQGLVHRDIKPGNILLENGVERVKITDFGLAQVIHEAQLGEGDQAVGTPQYMSPEQARGEPIDHRSDLFSLGCVLYAMCVGRSPFRADTPAAAIQRVCEQAPRPIAETNPEIPKWLIAVVDRLLAKDPDQRFQTAGEVADVLAGHLTRVQQTPRTPLPGAAPDLQAGWPGQFGFRRWAGAIAAAVGLAALLLIVVLALTQGTGKPRAFRSERPEKAGSLVPPSQADKPAAADAGLSPPSRDSPPASGASPEAEKERSAAAMRQLDEIVRREMAVSMAAANSYVLKGEWGLVAEELAKVMQKSPYSLMSVYEALAVAQLMDGDTKGYKATCAQAVRRFSDQKPDAQSFLVRLCCLTGESGVGLDRIIGYLRHAEPGGVSEHKFNVTLGFYLFRSGRHEELLTMVREQGDSYQVARVLLLRAMASQQLGRYEDASIHLEKACSMIEAEFFSPASHWGSNSRQSWVQWATLQILMREARQRIAPAEAPAAECPAR